MKSGLARAGAQEDIANAAKHLPKPSPGADPIQKRIHLKDRESCSDMIQIGKKEISVPAKPRQRPFHSKSVDFLAHRH